MPTTMASLLYEARRALSVGSQGDFGILLGSSRRSGQRWETGQALPSGDQLAALAGMLAPRNSALAEQIAKAAGTSLLALGLVKPPAPAPPPPPAPPPLPVEDVVDSVVCAAAEAMRVPPGDVRPALLAAFARARRLGLGIDVVEAVLAGATRNASV